jgi:RNA polymerase nonessential primary-like sigma factor
MVRNDHIDEIYYVEAGAAERLTAADEVRLSAVVLGPRSTPEERADARRRLVVANLRLVVCLAKRYRGHGVDTDDLVAFGNLGLIRATRSYDGRLGYRFSTYASNWIRQAIALGAGGTRHTVAVPRWASYRATMVLREMERSEVAGLPGPGFDAAASAVGVRDAHRPLVLCAMKAIGGYSSDAGIDEWYEARADNDLEARERREAVSRAVLRLSPVSREAVSRHFGLGGYEPHTRREVGEAMGLTRKVASQTIDTALRRLAGPLARAEGLDAPRRSVG